jgi:myosin heavy subunit
MVALRAIDRVTESPQLLLVTGESGAGKSFSAKTMLRFLTCRDLAADTGETGTEDGHSGRDADDAGGAADRARPRPRQPVSTKAGGLPPSSTGAVLTRLINGGSEILEAFGNARTRMNANSSRFGKFVQIEYDDQKRISGSRVRTFLLERTRLTSKVRIGCP